MSTAAPLVDSMRTLVKSLKLLLVAAVFAACGYLCVASARAQVGGNQGSESLATWLAGEGRGAKYLGAAVCAECHSDKATSFAASPMARALETAPNFDLLRKHPRLTFREGPYAYEIARRGDASVYTISANGRTISEPILFTFGLGVVGQTYVVKHGDTYYETRLSYFRDRDGLDLTVGHSHTVPGSIDDAIGRPLGGDDLPNCFGCHAPAALSGSTLTLAHAGTGLTCETCHGPGERHVASMKAGHFDELHVFNPGKLAGSDLTQDFCGSCHLSFERGMVLPGQGGPNNVRFQAYRIFNSRGHRSADARISCVACHDPHEGLEHDVAYYDAKCLACHVAAPSEPKTAARSAPACPVQRNGCTTCHMPKVKIEGMHASFTDHWIRVAKPGEPVPH